MTRPIEIFVLVDALGWRYVTARRFLADLLPWRWRVRSVLGNCSAAIPTMLSGRSPDQHGHWNLGHYAPGSSPFSWLRPLSVLPDSLLEHRVARRMLTGLGRRVLGMGPRFECTVPPRLLPWFDWAEKANIYAPGGIREASSIFDLLELLEVPHRVYTSHRAADADILRTARRDLVASEARFFFLYLNELDALLQRHCQDAGIWGLRLDWYADSLRELLALARRVDPKATLTVVSDHGMTPVQHHYDLAAEVDRLGFAMPTDYLAVYDSTMARFWFFSEHARAAIEARLGQLACGRLVPDAELRDLGVLFLDRRYGQVIYLLDPGWLISSRDFTGPHWTPTGMHGYHPDDPDSDGVFLSNNAPSMLVRTIADVHRCLEDAVTRTTTTRRVA